MAHNPDDLNRIEELRDELARQFAAARELADDTVAETERVAQAHDAEIEELTTRLADDAEAAAERAQLLHDAEIEMLAREHDLDVENLQRALISRDVIGQAKGILMVATHCDADEAFELLKKQSQAENRKLVEIAAEVVARVSGRSRPIPG